MKKLFTLLAVAAMAITASAKDVQLVSYGVSGVSDAGTAVSGTTTTGSVTVNGTKYASAYKLANSWGADNGNGVSLTCDGGFKAGDVVTYKGCISSGDATKYAKVVVVGENGEDAAIIYEPEENVVDVKTNTKVDATEYTYTLTSDYKSLKLGRAGNTGTFVIYISVTRKPSDVIAFFQETATIAISDPESFVAPTLNIPEGFSVVSYTSSNEDVATVDEAGKITPIAVGETTITATDNNGGTASYVLTVVDKVDPTFAFSAASFKVEVGAELVGLPTLSLSEGIEASEIKYAVSNKIAEISEAGELSILYPGMTKVTATFDGNSKYNAASASYLVEVTRPYVAVNPEGTVYGFISDMKDKVSFTYADGLTIAFASDKKITQMTGNQYTINGTKYDLIKCSNGAQVTLTAPEEKKIEQVTLLSTVNFDRKSKGYNERLPYWKELNGQTIDPSPENVMVNFTDKAEADRNAQPDVVTFAVDKLDKVTFTNTGEQPGVVIVVKYYEPVAPAAPTHNYGNETIVSAKDAAEVEFETEAEHHLVYTCFVPANKVAETNARAAADMTHESLEGATFTHAADNKVTVSESGTLHYFAYDPETELKSELKTLDFSVATGIATIAADGVEAVEYYNLQGQRVANPTQGGLYIRKAGSKAEKVIL